MNMKIRKSILLLQALVLLMPVGLSAQAGAKQVQMPEVRDFAPMLQFLASGWMEGREAGAKGGFMAADYIASMMQVFGISPNGDQMKAGEKEYKGNGYFQDFEILRHKTEKSSLAFVNRTMGSHSAVQLIPGIDFEAKGGTQNLDAETPVVFAGYGLTASDRGYDDYKGLDVKGKIVVVLDGFPGHADTTSTGWIKVGRYLDEDKASIYTKLRNARLHGAIALLLMDADGKFEAFVQAQSNRALLGSAMNAVQNTESDYEDFDHVLPNDTANEMIPLFKLGTSAGAQLISGTGLDLSDFERKTAYQAVPSSLLLKDKLVRLSVSVKTEALLVRNVLGIIPGKDTTKSIILGAHYDHLGMHNGILYNGSDDNASGASGLLALAKAWGGSGVQPACNLIFAAWTAEEKGLLGSQHFVQAMRLEPKNVKLYVNMDMISRSVVEDTARRQLSIGTRTADEAVRQIARRSNSTLSHPFELDLWDVTGHSGSDYASFTARNIPIMTYNTGLHNDYHTPRDISATADLQKMGDVLKVVNACLWEFLENGKGE
jgi:hypothetical protein